MDSMRKNAQKMMPHVMALNKKPTMGMKNDRQPVPAVSKLVAFAKGGKVMAKGGAADMKQDKAMLSRHNRLMHPGQKSKLMNGGMVSKYANGGGAFVTRQDKANIKARGLEYAKTASKILEEENKPLSKIKSFLTDNVEKMKEAVRSVGKPDYRDTKLTKVVRSGVDLGKGTLKVGKAITPIGAFLTAMTPSTLNEDEDDRIKKINKEYDQVKNSVKIDKVSPKDIKIDMPKLTSINITKKSSPKKEESGEEAVLRYNKQRDGDEDTQEQIKKAFASGPAKYAKGGAVEFPLAKRKKVKELTKMGINPYEPGKSENMEYAKGGKVKSKGDKKKVMGTVGEAKAMMAALQKARRPATPMPGTPMAGLGMAPPMAPPMKHGGKVMKKANGGMSRPLQNQRMPMRVKNAPLQAQRMPMRVKNAPQTRGPYGLDSRAIAADPAGYAKHLEGAKAQEALRPGSTFLSNQMKKGGKVMKKAAGGAAKLRRKSPMPDKIKMVNYSRGG
jgi:hypothetical protein